jgi:hypothetical protein
MYNYRLLNKILKITKYIISFLIITLFITSILMLTLCEDIDFNPNVKGVCNINISVMFFIIYDIVILIILSLLLCIINCYLVNINLYEINLLKNKPLLIYPQTLYNTLEQNY